MAFWRYDEPVSNYIVRPVMNVRLQIKAHFSDLYNLVPTICYLPAFKLDCDTNKIHEGAVMWLLLHFVKKCSQMYSAAKCTQKTDRLLYLSLFGRTKHARARYWSLTRKLSTIFSWKRLPRIRSMKRTTLYYCTTYSSCYPPSGWQLE